jgi:PPK2 family polyphosphate:nucleotide phosphotransferase
MLSTVLPERQSKYKCIVMSKFKLAKISADAKGPFRNREEAEKATQELQKKMYDLLYLMFAHDKYSLLIILQGIDCSGKDGSVRHIFAGANPQGVRVFSFKQPTPDELRHDFIWRCHKHAPESGLTTIFNRSYYEEVTTVKVHPELLESQKIPDEHLRRKDFFERRYKSINYFEKLLRDKGTVVLKCFLHISKKEQKIRIVERLKDRRRNWKFSPEDVKQRQFWARYMKAFEQMLNATSTHHAPWHVIPADNKWYRDYLLSKKIVETLEGLKMSFPKASVKNLRFR